MSLDAHIVIPRTGFTVDVPLGVAAGEVVALLGPNGAGKTTVLRGLAGLEPLRAGHIRLAGRALEDPAAGIRLPAQQRGVGLVYSEHLLFPHLSAVDNVAFGPRSRRTGRTAARTQAMTWLDRMGLAELADRRPGAFSAGQAQRVALARALAALPELVLLDEPLAALDAGTRMSVRPQLRRHLAGYEGVTVLVTHDPLDAMVLADRLVVLDRGEVVQAGTPAEVAGLPRSDYVARLVGLNLVRGKATDGAVALPGGAQVRTSEPASGDVWAVFRPSSVSLHPAPPQGSPRNVWPMTVVAVIPHGDAVRVQLAGPFPLVADVTPAAVADLRLAPASEVWAAVKATEVHAYPA